MGRHNGRPGMGRVGRVTYGRRRPRHLLAVAAANLPAKMAGSARAMQSAPRNTSLSIPCPACDVLDRGAAFPGTAAIEQEVELLEGAFGRSASPGRNDPLRELVASVPVWVRGDQAELPCEGASRSSVEKPMRVEVRQWARFECSVRPDFGRIDLGAARGEQRSADVACGRVHGQTPQPSPMPLLAPLLSLKRSTNPRGSPCARIRVAP
jgi:hypothetical protein